MTDTPANGRAMTYLRIKGWQRHFENNRSRELKRVDWVPIPNKLDGLNFLRLLKHPDGAAHFGVWILLIEIASKCNPRGSLLRDSGAAIIPQDVAEITRLDAGITQAAMDRLLHEIGWLEVVESIDSPHHAAGITHLPATFPHLPAGIPPQKGREGKGREGKCENHVHPSAAPPITATRFTKPTLRDLALYAADIQFSTFDADMFFDHYEANGWKVGRNPMKDWKATVRNWRKTNFSNGVSQPKQRPLYRFPLPPSTKETS